MTDHEKSRNHYEKSGIYDPNMEHFEECEVNSGAWVLVTRQIPVDERCKPHLFGIYWGVPKQDRFDRQICVIHTTEDVTLLNHEFTVIDDERLKVYREEGWELHENMAAADTGMNTELIEKGRALCEEEREILWALQLDGLKVIGRCLDLNIRYLIKAGIRYLIKTESRSQRVVCLILWDFNFTMTGQPSENQTLRLRDARQTISQSRIKSHGITHR